MPIVLLLVQCTKIVYVNGVFSKQENIRHSCLCVSSQPRYPYLPITHFFNPIVSSCSSPSRSSKKYILKNIFTNNLTIIFGKTSILGMLVDNCISSLVNAEETWAHDIWYLLLTQPASFILARLTEVIVWNCSPHYVVMTVHVQTFALQAPAVMFWMCQRYYSHLPTRPLLMRRTRTNV